METESILVVAQCWVCACATAENVGFLSEVVKTF